MTPADRIAQLEAELAEARDWVRKLTSETRILTCVYCGHAYPPGTPAHGSPVLTEHIASCKTHPLTIERAAHARTQAKLADVEARLLAAQGEAAVMRDWCAAWLIRARLAVYREGWEEGMSATEAADALTSVLFNLGCDDGSERSHDITETKRLLAMQVTYAPPSGRAFAERVPLWRELEEAARTVKREKQIVNEEAKRGVMHRIEGLTAADEAMFVVLRKLAALDEKPEPKENT